MVITISNQKGGVGKTTIAVHLAVWLFEHGASVAFFDADGQASGTKWLSKAGKSLARRRIWGHDKASEFYELVRLSRPKFDYIIVDAPGSLDEMTRSILLVSDLSLMPCGPSMLDLWGIVETLKTLRFVEEEIRHLKIPNILIPNKIQNYNPSHAMLDAVAQLGSKVSDPIKLRTAFAEAASQLTVVWHLKSQSGKDATAEMEALFQEIIPKIEKRDRSAAPEPPDPLEKLRGLSFSGENVGSDQTPQEIPRPEHDTETGQGT